MADVKWIKIVTDIFDDEKILLIESLPNPDEIIVIWFKLLCLAGKQNNSGIFILNNKIPYTDKMLATIFRRKESTVSLALRTFEEFGMIEIIDGVITIPNWNKHQSLEKIKQRQDYMRDYMRDRRKGICKQDDNDTVNINSDINKPECKPNCEQDCKLNVNTPDKNRIDKNKIREDKSMYSAEKSAPTPTQKSSSKKFIKPTVEEITQYCIERKNSVDPQRFFDYYESTGWKIGGKSSMKDWKAAIRNWERRENHGGNSRSDNSIDELYSEGLV